MIEPHENQAVRNHCAQDLEKLASRGGLGTSEACAVLEDRPYHPMTGKEAKRRLAELIEAFKSKPDFPVGVASDR